MGVNNPVMSAYLTLPSLTILLHVRSPSDVACLIVFQRKLTYLGLPSNLGQLSFNDTSGFVSSPRLCTGIQTKQDWIDIVGATTMDTVCKGDLSKASAYSIYHNSGEDAHRKLTGLIKNITVEISLTCYYFPCIYAAGVVNELGPMSVQAAACILRVPFLPKKHTFQGQILLCSCLGAAMAVLLSCLWICYRWWNKDAEHNIFVRQSRGLLKVVVKPNTGAVWFDIEEMKAATENFNAANVISQGVSVLCIRALSEGETQFINEAEIINRIRHQNLVVLRGFCIASDDIQGRQRFLVYDYMGNGSLDEHIFPGGINNRAPLTWEQRKNIAISTAKGLCYLHFSVQAAIYHRDIKATNILLDDQKNACVADFSLARITVEGESHLTTRIAGTHDYLAPEYALYGQLTDQSDVYSFGVVLLEIMSGRKALDNSVELPSNYLITDWAWRLVRSGKTAEVIDRRIREKGVRNAMERFVLVGILCAHVMVALRPSIAEALKMLEGEAEIPQIPDRPKPLSSQGSATFDYGSFLSNSQNSQPNNLTMTIALR